MSDRETWQRCRRGRAFSAPTSRSSTAAPAAISSTTRSSWRRWPTCARTRMMISLHSRHHPALPAPPTAAKSRSAATCPGAIRGEILLGIAMTEPGTGSDLANVQTRARRDGDHYVINGAKTFISNGQIGDLFIVVCQAPIPTPTRRTRASASILVEADAPGFVQRPQARQARPARPGHQRARLRGLPRAGVEPARRRRAGLQDADGAAPAGAPDDRRRARSRRAGRALDDTIDVRQAARRRSASRSPRSRTPSSRSPSSPPRSRSARRSSTSCWPRTCAARTSSPRSAWRSGGRRICRSGSPASACSSTAATASCSSTRSRWTTPTPRCSRSTPAPTRS